MSKNKVGKGREEKGREGKERKNLGWHFHPSVGENGVE
jgi:hypothetical protein